MRRSVPDEEIIAAYMELQSAPKVEERLGISQSVIYRALSRNGIESSGTQKYRERATLFDKEKSDQILERYEAGALIKDLVAEFGGSYYSIKRAICRAGGYVRSDPLPSALPRSQGIKRMSDNEIAMIRELRERGLTQVQIAEAIGRSQAGVGHILSKNEIRKPRIANSMPQQICDLYRSGLSMREIGKRLNVSTQCAHRWLKKMGVETRPWQGSGEEHSQWKGGRNKDVNGYWLVRLSKDDPMISMANHHRNVLEHRLVMARKLGRPLTPHETVHHIDGDRSNNSPDNLQLRQGKHGKHIVMRCNSCGSHDIGSEHIVEH